MENRKTKDAALPSESSLINFLTGVDATFGSLIDADAEHADFLAAAEVFYCDYKGISSSGRVREASLPFWRYLIHFSGVGLDRAASSKEKDKAASQGMEHLGTAMKGYWPLIPALVMRTYRDLASNKKKSTSVAVATQTEPILELPQLSSLKVRRPPFVA